MNSILSNSLSKLLTFQATYFLKNVFFKQRSLRVTRLLGNSFSRQLSLLETLFLNDSLCNQIFQNSTLQPLFPMNANNKFKFQAHFSRFSKKVLPRQTHFQGKSLSSNSLSSNSLFKYISLPSVAQSFR